MPQAEFVGIDLTSSPNRPSACVGLDKELNLAFTKLVTFDSEISDLAETYSPGIIGIDAPLALPEGLCCLEESCACQPERLEKGRECERILAKLGIPCYFSTKRSIIKEMVYRGIRLREELEHQGHRVIEVYPYASKIRLWGNPIPKKSRPEGLDFLRHRLAGLLPLLDPHVADFSHDLCDAAIAAHTAYLAWAGAAEPLGDSADGLIWAPKGEQTSRC
jgi:predicted nuclease with RNAse H fold